MLHIRRYQAADHDAVWDLHNLALHQVKAHVGNGWWDADLHAIESAYLNQRGEFLVGVFAGRIVAMGGIKHMADDTAEVTRMRVHPDYQGQGYGRAVLNALEKKAVALGYRLLQLSTTVQQTVAQRLYESNGYAEVSRGRVANFDVIYYQKVLPGKATTPPTLC